MKRSLGILVGLVFSTLALPAQAQVGTDGGLYISIGLGGFGGGFTEGSWVLSAEDAGAGTTTNGEYAFNYGTAATGAIGYVFAYPNSIADLRIEAEASYRLSDLETLSVIVTTDGEVTDAFVLDAQGRLDTRGIMINGYADFRFGPSRIVPFLGFGIGGARLATDDLRVDGESIESQVEYTGAWQFMAGLGYRVSSGMIINLEYRYFELRKFNFDDTISKHEIHFNELFLNFRFVI